MTLNAAIQAELPFLRAEAEARQLDTFDIKIQTGESYDPETDTVVPTFEALFTTTARVKVTGNVTRDSEVGARTAVEVTRELHIPVASPVVPTGALAVCTAVHATSDPTLLGAVLRVSGPAPGSQTTARRLQVEEVVG